MLNYPSLRYFKVACGRGVEEDERRNLIMFSLFCKNYGDVYSVCNCCRNTVQPAAVEEVRNAESGEPKSYQESFNFSALPGVAS